MRPSNQFCLLLTTNLYVTPSKPSAIDTIRLQDPEIRLAGTQDTREQTQLQRISFYRNRNSICVERPGKLESPRKTRNGEEETPISSVQAGTERQRRRPAPKLKWSRLDGSGRVADSPDHAVSPS